MPRLTAGQRKAQSYQVSANIDAAAREIATEQECTHAEAIGHVFHDPALLTRCHQVAGAGTFPPLWTEPKP